MQVAQAAFKGREGRASLALGLVESMHCVLCVITIAAMTDDAVVDVLEW